MLFFLLQLLALWLFLIVLLSLFKAKLLRRVIATLGSIFLLFQLTSIYIGGSMVDYKFFEHFNFNNLSLTLSLFKFQLLAGLLSGLGIYLLSLWLSKKLQSLVFYKKRFALPALALMLLPLSLKEGVLYNFYEIGKLRSATKTNFDDALANLGIDPEAYVKPAAIQAQKGKNVIILSLESLERSFLYENLAHLIPNLKSLQQTSQYFPIEEVKGGNWTQGSLYTLMTGFPYFFSGSNDRVFLQAEQPLLSTLSGVFQVAGYTQQFIMGRPDFGGTDHLIQSMGIPIISEKNASQSYPQSRWGLHDKDLFTELKSTLTAFNRSGESFAIYASTISTHGPDGVYDSRMEAFVEPQASNLEFCIKSLDYLIGDLIKHLKAEEMWDNTVLYIFPDHKLMGATYNVGNQFQDPRGLFLITNADSSQLRPYHQRPLSQLHLAPMILDGAEIKHNARFLADYLPKGTDGVSFVEEHMPQLLMLNEAGLAIKSFKDDLLIFLNSDEEIVLRSGNHEIKISGVDARGKQAAIIKFDEKMRLDHEIHAANVAFARPPEELHLFVCRKAERLYSYLRHGKQTYAFQEGLGQVSFPASFSKTVDKARSFQKNLFQHYPPVKEATPLFNNETVDLLSIGGWAEERLYISHIIAGQKPLPIDRGINVLTRTQAGLYEVQKFDTFQSPENVQDLIKRVQNLQKEKRFFVLLSEISAGEYLFDFKAELELIGLPVLAALPSYNAYIAYADRGMITERKADRILSLSFPFSPSARRTPEEIDQQAKDTMRFIAHAGGVIDGETYTNSLEALDANYAKGFRLFELDIRQTRDGHFVATHDWYAWKQKTKYPGVVPPTLADFHKYKIKDRYTPMDISGINLWFKTHPDAILVTDKINDPMAFVPAFIDKSRLMMELFNKQAVEQAMSLDIRSAMPSMNVFFHRNNRIEFLQDLGVRDIAVSVDLIHQDPNIFAEIQQVGIRTYVFHVNGKPWINEKHIVLDEMDFCYGLYADDWDF